MKLVVFKNRCKIALKTIVRRLRADRSSPYVSQNGQDRFLAEHIFQGVTDGYFVDIGANDGVTYSNTYYFEKRGWKGLCIEPIPEVFEKLRANRNCECLWGVLSSKQAPFAELLHVVGYSEMLSGVVDAYETQHAERVKRELREYGGKAEVVKVPNYLFNEVVAQTHIDYVSIDVEGSEYDILKSIDFKKYTVKVISVENPYNNRAMHSYLQASGFEFLQTVGADDIFINQQYAHLRQ